MALTEIVKMFGERKVRSIWDDAAENWYFSVVDVVAVLTESADPRNYWKVLKNRLKKEGYARKVGVSVYEVDEAKKCIERDNVDFMQLPYSVFDQRMKNGGLFDMAKKHPVATQIHSRSAFIQGLILMDEEQVPDFLSKARPIVRKISELCSRYEISRIALAMNYVKQLKNVAIWMELMYFIIHSIPILN